MNMKVHIKPDHPEKHFSAGDLVSSENSTVYLLLKRESPEGEAHPWYDAWSFSTEQKTKIKPHLFRKFLGTVTLTQD